MDTKANPPRMSERRYRNLVDQAVDRLLGLPRKQVPIVPSTTRKSVRLGRLSGSASRTVIAKRRAANKRARAARRMHRKAARR